MNVHNENAIALYIVYLCWHCVCMLALYGNSLQNDFMFDHK